jgi:CreA protein
VGMTGAQGSTRPEAACCPEPRAKHFGDPLLPHLLKVASGWDSRTAAIASSIPACDLYIGVPKVGVEVQTMNRLHFWCVILARMVALLIALTPALMPVHAAEEPDLIFKRSTVFKWLTPNDKLATYGLDDPEVEGVACHFTVPEKGGFKGWVGVAEEVSDISLACRQIGPIRIKAKFEQGEDVFRKRRSLFFKKMQIVRGCDVKRNVLVYMVYSDRLIEGSPKNSTSTVPIMPWGASDQIQRCADFVEH